MGHTACTERQRLYIQGWTLPLLLLKRERCHSIRQRTQLCCIQKQSLFVVTIFGEEPQWFSQRYHWWAKTSRDMTFCCRLQLKYDGTRWCKGGKWRGNWRMEWVTSTLHTTSEHGVSSITTADAHTSAASSRLNWRSRRFKWTGRFRRKTKSGFCACAITFQTQFSVRTVK